MTSPNRGTEAVWPVEGGLAVLCDCGTVTEVRFSFHSEDGALVGAVPDHAAVAAQEIAVGCDTCGSSHWLTILPSLPPPEDPVVTA